MEVSPPDSIGQVLVRVQGRGQRVSLWQGAPCSQELPSCCWGQQGHQPLSSCMNRGSTLLKDHNTLWEGAEEETHKNSLGHLYKFFHKFVIDALLHKDATGGEAYLTLVGKGGTDHGGKTLLQVGIVKYNTRIFATKLICGIGRGWMHA